MLQITITTVECGLQGLSISGVVLRVRLDVKSSWGGRTNSMETPWGVTEFIPGYVAMPPFSIMPIATMISYPWGPALITAGSMWVAVSETMKLDRSWVFTGNMDHCSHHFPHGVVIDMFMICWMDWYVVRSSMGLTIYGWYHRVSI